MRLISVWIFEPSGAFTPEPTPDVGASGFGMAVVQILRHALVQVLNIRHGTWRTFDEQRGVADVVVAPVNHAEQMSLDVALQRGSRRFPILLNHQREVHEDASKSLGRVALVNVVDLRFHELIRKRRHAHRRVDL